MKRPSMASLNEGAEKSEMDVTSCHLLLPQVCIVGTPASRGNNSDRYGQNVPTAAHHSQT